MPKFLHFYVDHGLPLEDVMRNTEEENHFKHYYHPSKPDDEAVLEKAQRRLWLYIISRFDREV